MNLPLQPELSVSKLAGCFNNTTATYKFYWLLSIIQSVESGAYTIRKKDLFARMISNAWYTVNYFHVSFGKLDKLQSAIEVIKNVEKIVIDEDKITVFNVISKSENPVTVRELNQFNSNVPHWFLSPWFPKKNKSEIYKLSSSFRENCLYALRDDDVVINPDWKDYLLQNARILKDFCYWNLALFLQKKNPNVPNIPNKLIKPLERKGLTSQRKSFWDKVFNRLKSIECIYTKNLLTRDNYTLDHFIPHNFVSHDLIWNLIPSDGPFGSVKSDKLPRLDRYFESFFEVQMNAIEIISREDSKNKYLQDYVTIFPEYVAGGYIDRNEFRKMFKQTLKPLITIASNNGFEFMRYEAE